MLNPLVSALNFVTSSLSFITGSDNLPQKNGVLILTQENFKNALAQHELLMVKFYLPWCAGCKSFAPEYLKLGQMLKLQNSHVQLGQVNADVETDLVRQHKIVRFPALRLFKRGTPVSYDGDKDAQQIITWLNRHCSDH